MDMNIICQMHFYFMNLLKAILTKEFIILQLPKTKAQIKNKIEWFNPCLNSVSVSSKQEFTHS